MRIKYEKKKNKIKCQYDPRALVTVIQFNYPYMIECVALDIKIWQYYWIYNTLNKALLTSSQRPASLQRVSQMQHKKKERKGSFEQKKNIRESHITTTNEKNTNRVEARMERVKEKRKKEKKNHKLQRIKLCTLHITFLSKNIHGIIVCVCVCVWCRAHSMLFLVIYSSEMVKVIVNIVVLQQRHSIQNNNNKIQDKK